MYTALGNQGLSRPSMIWDGPHIIYVHQLSIIKFKTGFVRPRLWYILSPLDGASVREPHCQQASEAHRLIAIRAGQEYFVLNYNL